MRGVYRVVVQRFVLRALVRETAIPFSPRRYCRLNDNPDREVQDVVDMKLPLAFCLQELGGSVQFCNNSRRPNLLPKLFPRHILRGRAVQRHAEQASGTLIEPLESGRAYLGNLRNPTEREDTAEQGRMLFRSREVHAHIAFARSK